MFFKIGTELVNINSIDTISGRVEVKRPLDIENNEMAPPHADISLTVKTFGGYNVRLFPKDSAAFLNQVEEMHQEERDKVFSLAAQRYLGNLLVERDEKQAEVESG